MKRKLQFYLSCCYLRVQYNVLIVQSSVAVNICGKFCEINRGYYIFRILFHVKHSSHFRFKAIPHKDCATDTSSNFSSDETKSGVNTGCIHEHFCEI